MIEKKECRKWVSGVIGVMLILLGVFLSQSLQTHAADLTLTDMKISEDETSKTAVKAGDQILYDDSRITVDLTWSDESVTIARKGDEEWQKAGLQSDISNLEGDYAVTVFTDELSVGLPLTVYDAGDNKEILALTQQTPVNLSAEKDYGVWSFTPENKGVYQFLMQTKTGTARMKYYLTDGDTILQTGDLKLSQTEVTGEEIVLKKAREYYLVGFLSEYENGAQAITTVQAPEMDSFELTQGVTSSIPDTVEYVSFTAPEEGLYLLRGMAANETVLKAYTDGSDEVFGLEDKDAAFGCVYLKASENLLLKPDSAVQWTVTVSKHDGLLKVSSVNGLEAGNYDIRTYTSADEFLSQYDYLIEYVLDEQNNTKIVEQYTLKGIGTDTGKYGNQISITMTDEFGDEVLGSDDVGISYSGEQYVEYTVVMTIDGEQIAENKIKIGMNTSIDVGGDDHDTLTKDFGTATELSVDGDYVNYPEVTGDEFDSFQFTPETAGDYIIDVSGHREGNSPEAAEWVSINAYIAESGEDYSGYMMLDSKCGYSPKLKVRLEAGQTCWFVLYEDENRGDYEVKSYGQVKVRTATEKISAIDLQLEDNTVFDVYSFADKIQTLEVLVTYDDNKTEMVPLNVVISDGQDDNRTYQMVSGGTNSGDQICLKLNDENGQKIYTEISSEFCPAGVRSFSAYVRGSKADPEYAEGDSSSVENIEADTVAVRMNEPGEDTEELTVEKTGSYQLAKEESSWYALNARPGQYTLTTTAGENETAHPDMILYEYDPQTGYYMIDYRKEALDIVIDEGHNYYVLLYAYDTQVSGELALETGMEVKEAGFLKQVVILPVNAGEAFWNENIYTLYDSATEKVVFHNSWKENQTTDAEGKPVVRFSAVAGAGQPLVIEAVPVDNASYSPEGGLGIGTWKLSGTLDGTEFSNDCILILTEGNDADEALEVTLPETTEVIKGESVTLSAKYSGSGKETYQWYVDGVAIKDATQKEYTIRSAAKSAFYTCIVTEENGEYGYVSTALVVDESKCSHNWSSWKKISEATVLKKAKYSRTCSICGETETAERGSKLKATIKVTATSFVMQRNQKTSGFSVTMGKGDYVKSWKSSNTKILTVSGSNSGKCSLKAKKKIGKVKLTITLASGLEKTVTVKVQKAKVKTTAIKGLKKTITIKKGKKITLKPTRVPFTTQDKLKFKSLNKKIAVVNGKGVVTAKKSGKAKIQVISGKKKYSVTVKVQ